MSDYNRTIIAGRLTRDPEMRATAGGAMVCSFGIANNRTFVSDGKKREKVCFIDAALWGKRGEVVAKYFSKGKPIIIEGQLELREWTDKNGNKKSRHFINCDGFEFVSDPKERGSNGHQMGTKPDDDLPF